MDPWGSFLATGDENGCLIVYNTKTFEKQIETTSHEEVRDCINSCSFHPHSALIFSCSGHRHFPSDTEYDDSDEEELSRTVGKVLTGESSNPVGIKKRSRLSQSHSALQVWRAGFNSLQCAW